MTWARGAPAKRYPPLNPEVVARLVRGEHPPEAHRMELYAAFVVMNKAGAYASTIASTLGCNQRTVHKPRASLRDGAFPERLLQRKEQG